MIPYLKPFQLCLDPNALQSILLNPLTFQNMLDGHWTPEDRQWNQAGLRGGRITNE